MEMFNIYKKATAAFTALTLAAGCMVMASSALPARAYADTDDSEPPQAYVDDSVPAYAETDIPRTFQRFAGLNRYETAVDISSKNWFEAYNVVLARGDDFPDALAGAVLANSAMAQGPLLLTESQKLRPDVLAEMQRLRTQNVFILGGTGAVSAGVEQELKDNGLQVYRIEGANRFETAANIAATAVESNPRAFLASGQVFADALSVSSYAAAQGIPMLLTDTKKVPDATLEALKSLGTTQVTLIGGEGAIAASVVDQLTALGYTVDRLSGQDRYETNVAILNTLDFDTSRIVVATGTSFPDALAGSVLAARENNPILLVPADENVLNNSQTGSYMNTIRANVNHFFILGGWGVINYKVENRVRTGKANPRVSLQFWNGYGVKAEYERLLSYVPGNLTDYIHILVPNLCGEVQADGSFAYRFASSAEETAKYLVTLGKSKGARVVPMVMGSGTIANEMLRDDVKRKNFADSAIKIVEDTKADGILVDLESLADDTEQGLTALMRDLYTRLNPKGKLVMISVMSKTSKTAESWYDEYNYADLAKYTDFIQIMSYDKHYSTSAPGPIAPLDWVRKVMAYAVTEIPSEKILMGVPYYGRSWKQSADGKWTSIAFGWTVATQTAEQYGADITRETTPTDLIGVPTFRYVDADGNQRTAYFDDRLSWGAKFNLMDEFSLGGIGGWAMSWVNEISAPELYPLLKERMN